MTQIQIIQFIINIVLQLRVYYLHFGLEKKCAAFDSWGNEFATAVVASYLILFILFYIKTYTDKKQKVK